MSTPPASPTVPRLLSWLVSLILRTPVLHRVMSRDIMLLSVTGRTTGRTYTFPVSYQHDHDSVICYTDHGWWRNLRGGGPVSMLIAGRRLHGTGAVVEQDHQATVTTLRAFLHATPRDAKFHNVGRTPAGDLDPEDLQRAAQRSVMIRIRIDSPASGLKRSSLRRACTASAGRVSHIR